MKKVLLIILIILLVGSMGFNVYSILDKNKSTNKYNDLVAEKESIEAEKSEYKSRALGAESRYSALEKEYDKLKEENKVLTDFYNEHYVPAPKEPENLDGYRKDVTFDDLSRKPNDYKGEYVCYTGKVVQLLEKEDEINLRIAINGDYDEIIYVGYFPTTSSERVLENDNVTIYGQYLGIVQYESVMTTISIPAVWVDHIKINK